MTAVVNAFPRVALFDLDGTLLDSAPDMLATVDAMRAARGRGPMSMDVLRPVVSKGARAMTAAAFPDVPASSSARSMASMPSNGVPCRPSSRW